MRTKSYSIAPKRRGVRARQHKDSKNDGSTLRSAIVIGNHPHVIGASAICGEAMSIRIYSDLGTGRREGSGSDDRRAAQKS